MKRCIALLLVLVLLLSACSIGVEPPATSADLPSESTGKETELPETKETELPETKATEPPETKATEPPETQGTEPPHSQFYIPGVSVADVIRYFNEVCLAAEFSDGGDPSVLQRWEIPICYKLNGMPTQDDIAVLEGFVKWLNTIEGFPGIKKSESPEERVNLNFHFCKQSEIIPILGPNFTNVDGGVTFWYQNNAIYSEIICVRNDMDQKLRNSVIQEELYNGLGPVQDTDLRPDSIIYSQFSQPQSLTEVDELILRLLYHPNLKPGMNRTQCEKIIRQLYY